MIIRAGELYLFWGPLFSPWQRRLRPISPDPTRTRKLLLNANEISKVIGGVERKGLHPGAVIALLEKGRAKLKIALAKGKKQQQARQHPPARVGP